MKIQAKFASLCPACDAAINAGEVVEWSRGERAKHLTCSAPKPALHLVPALVVDPEVELANEECDVVPVKSCGKRPSSVMRRVSVADLDWTPEKVETTYLSASGTTTIRNGDHHAIIRPGHLWPLGQSSDHRCVIGHTATRAMVLDSFPNQVAGEDHAYISGHGYRVVQYFSVLGLDDLFTGGHRISFQLLVVNDHTGAGSLRAALTLFVDGVPIGSRATATALHVSANPQIWSGEVSAMIEAALIEGANDDLVSLITRASNRDLDDSDRKWLAAKGVPTRKYDRTLLDAMRSWQGCGKTKATWGVWSRSLDLRPLDIMRAFFEMDGHMLRFLRDARLTGL